MESHVACAAAFVEGGIQDACDDACSICLESFCENNPSTVTCCRHEFHLQCILEWCQRSSQCPMCWQAISLKDLTSQELLEAVERERTMRVNQPRNTTVIHYPTLGNFELQHLSVGESEDSELEEHIIQQLAHIARRERQRRRGPAHIPPQFRVLSNNLSNLSTSSEGGENESVDEVNLPSGNISAPSNTTTAFSCSRSFADQSSVNNQDKAGPSDFQSFSESLKSRLSAASLRYKDTITKSTRGWKERFFTRNTSISETMSNLIERLETRDNAREASVSCTQVFQGHQVEETRNESVMENYDNTNPISSSSSTSSRRN